MAVSHWLSDWFKPKEEKKEIPVYDAVFNYTDGKKVRRQAGVFSLRSREPLQLLKDEKQLVKLGVSCDRPVLLLESRGVAGRNVRFDASQAPTADAGQEITVLLENRSASTQYFEAGDVVARCFVLSNDGLEVGGVE